MRNLHIVPSYAPNKVRDLLEKLEENVMVNCCLADIDYRLFVAYAGYVAWKGLQLMFLPPDPAKKLTEEVVREAAESVGDRQTLLVRIFDHLSEKLTPYLVERFAKTYEALMALGREQLSQQFPAMLEQYLATFSLDRRHYYSLPPEEYRLLGELFRCLGCKTVYNGVANVGYMAPNLGDDADYYGCMGDAELLLTDMLCEVRGHGRPHAAQSVDELEARDTMFDGVCLPLVEMGEEPDEPGLLMARNSLLAEKAFVMVVDSRKCHFAEDDDSPLACFTRQDDIDMVIELPPSATCHHTILIYGGVLSPVNSSTTFIDARSMKIPTPGGSDVLDVERIMETVRTPYAPHSYSAYANAIQLRDYALSPLYYFKGKHPVAGQKWLRMSKLLTLLEGVPVSEAHASVSIVSRHYFERFLPEIHMARNVTFTPTDEHLTLGCCTYVCRSRLVALRYTKDRGYTFYTHDADGETIALPADAAVFEVNDRLPEAARLSLDYIISLLQHTAPFGKYGFRIPAQRVADLVASVPGDAVEASKRLDDSLEMYFGWQIERLEAQIKKLRGEA